MHLVDGGTNPEVSMQKLRRNHIHATANEKKRRHRTFHKNNTYIHMSSKQHRKPTWRHEMPDIRHCLFQKHHSWVYFLTTDKTTVIILCMRHWSLTKVCAIKLSWCLQRNTMQIHKLISLFNSHSTIKLPHRDCTME